jgi:hypothetical protein
VQPGPANPTPPNATPPNATPPNATPPKVTPNPNPVTPQAGSTKDVSVFKFDPASPRVARSVGRSCDADGPATRPPCCSSAVGKWGQTSLYGAVRPTYLFHSSTVGLRPARLPWRLPNRV